MWHGSSVPTCVVLLAVHLLFSSALALRLQISDVYCFRKNIEIAESKVTLSIVSDDLHGKPVFFDIMARDPRSDVVFSKVELKDAELNFKTRVAGLHSFCLRVSSKSRTHADTIASPRVKKQLRTVAVDVRVGEPLGHDRIQPGDLVGMMEEVSEVKQSVQNLLSTAKHMKMTGAHDRDAVLMKNRNVMLFSMGKLVMLMVLFMVQPVVMHSWFDANTKY